MGLPIVSTAFAEVEYYRDRVRVASDHVGFVDLVRASIADGGPCDSTSLRRSVLDSSWEARAAELLALVERGPESGGTASSGTVVTREVPCRYTY